MIHHMENTKNQGACRKKIKVRKPRTFPETSESNLNCEEDYYIPVASNDSQWNGIQFSTPKDENTEHCLTDIENEIKVIELENEDSPPLLLLFPELKSEEFNFQSILRRDVSTTDVTRMLVGKKPNLTLLKPCKKLNNKRLRLSSVAELSESEISIEIKKPNYKKEEFQDNSTHSYKSDED